MTAYKPAFDLDVVKLSESGISAGGHPWAEVVAHAAGLIALERSDPHGKRPVPVPTNGKGGGGGEKSRAATL